jgi:hypothetical protein
MSNHDRILSAMSATKDAKRVAADSDSALTDLMANPEYLRHSSSVIHEALREGFDVLQLPNGDIVTTGTKVIVTTYSWDMAKAKLTKRTTGLDDKPKSTRRSKKDAGAEA